MSKKILIIVGLVVSGEALLYGLTHIVDASYFIGLNIVLGLVLWFLAFGAALAYWEEL